MAPQRPDETIPSSINVPSGIAIAPSQSTWTPTETDTFATTTNDLESILSTTTAGSTRTSISAANSPAPSSNDGYTIYTPDENDGNPFLTKSAVAGLVVGLVLGSFALLAIFILAARCVKRRSLIMAATPPNSSRGHDIWHRKPEMLRQYWSRHRRSASQRTIMIRHIPTRWSRRRKQGILVIVPERSWVQMGIVMS
ncbi:hypothetical protein PMZ80_000356 [Knufia obscura]|uniref:Uncharacterized protein n=1 Tax=Knufia obscura TaxID=1635080 RepID=A0ABR0S050_9EURO|nr:hypothetical protein PMZ80_000356 [Knufia obscura]